MSERRVSRRVDSDLPFVTFPAAEADGPSAWANRKIFPVMTPVVSGGGREDQSYPIQHAPVVPVMRPGCDSLTVKVGHAARGPIGLTAEAASPLGAIWWGRRAAAGRSADAEPAPEVLP